MSTKKLIITTSVCIACFFIILFGSEIKKSPAISQVKNEVKKDEAMENSEDIKEKNISDKNDSSGSGEEIQKESTSSKYKDGTYTGVGSGFKGDMSISLSIESGKISSIEVVDSQDDAEYLDRAKTLIGDIISSQNPEVSVVSGATYSSNGIINGVKDALRKGEN